MKTRDIDLVLQLLKDERGFDFSGSSRTVVENGIEQRIRETGTTACSEYYDYISRNPEEYDHLVQSLTINVSRFFRDPLVFDYLSEVIFPEILGRKAEKGDPDFRIWSAGCASGEEPYSVAIALKELAERLNGSFNSYIFGTDIDRGVLLLAESALFSKQSIENIRYGYMKYFSLHGGGFRLKDEVRRMVSFSRHDLLDKKNVVPPECIFSDFDIVFCRNVLIYFTSKLRETAFDKLYRSLSSGGYLVLGEAEAPPQRYMKYLKKAGDCCQVYQRVK